MSLSDATSQGNLLQLGNYALDPWRNVLRCGPREVQLSPLGSRLLQELAKRPGEMFERAELIDALWRGDWLVGDPALSRLVSEVRRAAGDNSREPTLIQTVPRRGYRLVAAAVSSEVAPALPAPRWSQAWRQANVSLLILFGGFALLLALAILARLLR